MSDERQPDGVPISATQLKARLKALGGIAPPAGLRDRLMAAVPDGGSHQAGRPAVSSWPGILRHVALAAGIVVMASVMVRFLTPLPGPRGPVVDMNDRGGATALADYNHPGPLDSNCCHSNVVP